MTSNVNGTPAGNGQAPWSAGVGLPELHTPPADRPVRDGDTAPEHHLLHLTEAERKEEVQPHAVGDDLDRVPVPLYDGNALTTDDPPPA